MYQSRIYRILRILFESAAGILAPVSTSAAVRPAVFTSGGVGLDLEQIEEQVQDVQIERHRHIDGVVEGGRDVAGTVHVVADVEREDTGADIVDDAELPQSRNEDLHEAHGDQDEKRTEQGATDAPIEVRERQSRGSHHGGHDGGQERGVCDHPGVTEFRRCQQRPQECAEGYRNQGEAEEGQGGAAAVTEQDADEG